LRHRQKEWVARAGRRGSASRNRKSARGERVFERRRAGAWEPSAALGMGPERNQVKMGPTRKE
jgi:hypothetical protein